MKKRLLSLLTLDPCATVWSPLRRNVATVFMLHRFADPELGVSGHDPELLRQQLAYLRSRRYRLMALAELVEELRSGHAPPASAVVFTVDDGYADFLHIAQPIFAEFDCPVTVFLGTGGLDTSEWYWWDRVTWAIENTRHQSMELRLGVRGVKYELREARHRRAAADHLVESLKQVEDDVRRATLEQLPEALDVEIPSSSPPAYRAMTWDQVRSCAARGATFGPHSVTHPMLERLGTADVEREVVDSWERVRSETDAAVPIFCYPNGDCSPREMAVVRRAGLEAAVTSVAAYTRRVKPDEDQDTLFALPRFWCPHDMAHFIQIVSGLGRLTQAIRRRLR